MGFLLVGAQEAAPGALRLLSVGHRPHRLRWRALLVTAPGTAPQREFPPQHALQFLRFPAGLTWGKRCLFFSTPASWTAKEANTVTL